VLHHILTECYCSEADTKAKTNKTVLSAQQKMEFDGVCLINDGRELQAGAAATENAREPSD